MTHARAFSQPTLRKTAHKLQKDATLKAVLSTITAVALAALSATPALVWVPGVISLLLVMTDGGTGMIAAAYEGRFWSKASWQGAGAKMGVYLIFAVPSWFSGYLIAEHLKQPLGWALPNACCAWINVTEIASIRENIRRIQKCKVKLGPIYKFLDAWDDILKRIVNATTDHESDDTKRAK